jgi:3,4-dihydroxy-9,10-secoandrosta-1,3,5(10)-triene-9,17-dione 4,5-dioxygenase
MDDVGRAYDLCRDENVVVLELGRLMPDDDISFYLRTPSGVDIQYGHGGRMIADDEKWTNPATMTDTRVWGHKVLIQGLGAAVRPAQEAASE